MIELGAIELIGRHANVQYWECLNIPATKTKAAERKESIFSSADKLRRIPEAQMMLEHLGFKEPASLIERAVESCIEANETPVELQGNLGTKEVGDAVCRRIRES